MMAPPPFKPLFVPRLSISGIALLSFFSRDLIVSVLAGVLASACLDFGGECLHSVEVLIWLVRWHWGPIMASMRLVLNV
ncbi:hypothetical protein EDC04DRAFT_2682150 [Pisolithus marmoratus]|nr:hypothetical protein EDC04DRAFT_2682150 [Pisolithus marmoratus]